MVDAAGKELAGTPVIGTVPTPPVPLSACTNGIAWDPVADCLWMPRDTGDLIACDRSGALRRDRCPYPPTATSA